MDSKGVQDVKVVVIGDAAAGKSAIVKKFFDGEFDENGSATIGIDFRHISYQLQDGTKVRLQVWDTAGQERFRQLVPSYVRDAHVILIVFDLTSSNIVEQIARWTLFAEREREEGAKVVIVGNKCDLRHRQMDKFIMNRMMAEYNAVYVETSAKTGVNVDESISSKFFATGTRCELSFEPPRGVTRATFHVVLRTAANAKLTHDRAWQAAQDSIGLLWLVTGTNGDVAGACSKIAMINGIMGITALFDCCSSTLSQASKKPIGANSTLLRFKAERLAVDELLLLAGRSHQ